MALSQLRPLIEEGDRPASKSDFVRLPGGGLILTGQKPVEAKPGMLAGLRDYFAAKLNPQQTQDRYWIPQDTPVAPVAAPVQAHPSLLSAPGSALPQYNEWAEIEDQVAREQKIKDELGGVSKAVLASPAIIEGKWLGGR